MSAMDVNGFKVARVNNIFKIVRLVDIAYITRLVDIPYREMRKSNIEY